MAGRQDEGADEAKRGAGAGAAGGGKPLGFPCGLWLEDFVQAVAEGRPAVSDGELGLEVVRVIYSAYLSAEQGRRVPLEGR